MKFEDLEVESEKENTWCPGCGNFGLLNAVKKAVKRLEEEDVGRERLLISAGIGCHGKIFDYLNLSGLYSIHGREISTIQGMKFADPDLKVMAFGGDGDAYGEGLAHLIYAARRNADVTMIVHNNENYALTTGQKSPTSVEGFKGPSSPKGSVDEPLNPLTIMLSSGAGFVSRGYSGDIKHLTDLIVEAVKHEGFSLVDVLQPCVTFNDTYEKYNDLVEVIDEPAKTREEAVGLAEEKERLPIGILYKEEMPVFNEKVYPDKNPVEDKMDEEERLEAVKDILDGKR
ncbi:MAG: thiamine pyrophosphate-dependent enzyme [Candidatus Aenigmatarchaeota archaeon]